MCAMTHWYVCHWITRPALCTNQCPLTQRWILVASNPWSTSHSGLVLRDASEPLGEPKMHHFSVRNLRVSYAGDGDVLVLLSWNKRRHKSKWFAWYECHGNEPTCSVDALLMKRYVGMLQHTFCMWQHTFKKKKVQKMPVEKQLGFLLWNDVCPYYEAAPLKRLRNCANLHCYVVVVCHNDAFSQVQSD